MTLNQNQFQPTPVAGQLDLQVTESGLLSGQISANQATALVGGTPVILDTANTGPLPQFIGADDDDVVVFLLPFSNKKDSYVAGDAVEVAALFGPVVWGVAGAAILPGAVLEQANTTFKYITKATHKARGIAIDPAAADGDLFRVALMAPAAVNS